jgi:hypothetical protein
MISPLYSAAAVPKLAFLVNEQNAKEITANVKCAGSLHGSQAGNHEQDVWSSIGTPSSVVTRTGSDELSVEVGNEGDTSPKTISASDRSSWPAELEFSASA